MTKQKYWQDCYDFYRESHLRDEAKIMADADVALAIYRGEIDDDDRNPSD